MNALIARRTALTLLPGLVLVGRRSFAQEAAAPQNGTPGDVTSASVPLDPGASNAELDDIIMKFKEESGLGQRERAGELDILSGTATVKVPETNPEWVKYRMEAFKEALIEAEADFVARKSVFHMERTVRDFESNGAQAPEYQDVRTPGAAADLIRKIVAVANGEADTKLREMGIDPTAYERAPEAQRTKLLTDSLKTESIKHAFGDLVGLLPVQTFEHRAGNHTIAVVAVVSNKQKDFAARLLSAKGNFEPDLKNAKDVRQLVSDTSKLFQQFGVRHLADERGLPVLISYGQWQSSFKGVDEGIAASYYRAAVRQAESIADSQIADYLNASLNFVFKGNDGVELEKTAVTLPDSAREEDTKQLVDTVMRHMKRSASMQISGLRTLRNWTAKYPGTDQTIIGVVRIWSAADERNQRDLMQDRTEISPNGGNSPRPGGATGIVRGDMMMNSSDF